MNWKSSWNLFLIILLFSLPALIPLVLELLVHLLRSKKREAEAVAKIRGENPGAARQKSDP